MGLILDACRTNENLDYQAVDETRLNTFGVAIPESSFNASHRLGVSTAQLAIKRIVDIVVAGTSLIVLSPVLLIVALLIRLDSPGPALFTQVRWGKDCRKIRVFKFRSMQSTQCDESGVSQTIKDDPRITRVGSIIRKTNIDELPQLINVLVGNMSLVGPRCHAIGMLAGGIPYEQLVPAYHDRHVVKPGMTGLAQMRGLRGPTDRRDRARARIACDLYYIERFSIVLDFKIIVGTILHEIRGGSGF